MHPRKGEENPSQGAIEVKHIGWRWLAVREDRETIFKYVKVPPNTYCPDWPKDDPDYESIQRDQKIIQLLSTGMSLRNVAARVDRSYNHVARCRDIYAGKLELPITVETPEDRERQAFFKESREKLTREDVKGYLSGSIPLREFSKRMRCNSDDAYYWLKVAAARYKIKWQR